MTRPRLRTVLLLVNLIVILVPLSSVYLFRLFENELVRQTEAELVDQGAFAAALFGREIASPVGDYGRQVAQAPPKLDETYHPYAGDLDLRTTPVLGPRPDGTQGASPDAKALAIGRSIEPVIAETRLTTLASLILLDFRGVAVTGREAGLSFASLEEVASALGGQPRSVIRERHSTHPVPALGSISRGTEIRVFVCLPVIKENRVVGAVLLSRSPRNVLKALYEEKRGAVEAAAFVLIAVLLISWLTSRAVSRPIETLLRQVRRVGEGHPALADKKAMTMEMAELSAQIEWMASRLKLRSDYIRRFALHLSHEFKTPLTAIQGALELLEEHGEAMSAEERRRFFRNTSEDTARLNALVTRMLELARADALSPAPETCEAEPLVAGLAERYREQGLQVLFSAEPPGICLPMARHLLETVLVNLLSNSLLGGARQAGITAFTQAGRFHLRIADDGRGISAANQPQLFTPFFTTHREAGGTGLGLSIVQALLAAHGATIALTAARPHATFEIVF